MKKSYNLIIAFIVFSLSFANNLFGQPKIKIVYPKENSTVVASDSMHVYGNMWPKKAQVFINGKKAETYRNGTFMGVIPVETGIFQIKAQVLFEGDTSETKTQVYVPFYLKTSSETKLTIDTSYVFPREDLILRPGDIIKVAVKGTPGCKAFFTIKGIVKKFPMVELKPRKRYYWGESLFGEGINYQMSEVKGIYTGTYIIQTWDWGEKLPVQFMLQDENGNVVQTQSKGTLTIDVSTIPKIAEIRENAIYPKSGTQIGTQLFLYRGARVRVVAQRGKYAKIEYTKDKKMWVRKAILEILPPGSTIPEGIVSSVKSISSDGWVSLEINLDQRVPFKVSEFLKPTRLEVRFYHARLWQDSIRLDINDRLINNIHWENENEDVLKLVIDINQKHHWGYDPYYQNGKFYLNIKKKPQTGGWLRSPLKDLVICLDPGHSPDLGAISPSGIPEKDINFEYCKALKEKLENKGAVVYLTREKVEGITLQSRIQFAKFINADIFISIHFNGIPDGVNPFPIRGISTYYNQPHSYRLAALMQRRMLEATRAPNFGLYYSNLYVCRFPQTISVLLEPGFITHPVEEMMIMSKNYRTRVVNAIVTALEQFMKETR